MVYARSESTCHKADSSDPIGEQRKHPSNAPANDIHRIAAPGCTVAPVGAPSNRGEEAIWLPSLNGGLRRPAIDRCPLRGKSRPGSGIPGVSNLPDSACRALAPLFPSLSRGSFGGGSSCAVSSCNLWIITSSAGWRCAERVRTPEAVATAGGGEVAPLRYRGHNTGRVISGCRTRGWQQTLAEHRPGSRGASHDFIVRVHRADS